jgi:indolepyruvate ferredoxin oxidoreductase
MSHVTSHATPVAIRPKSSFQLTDRINLDTGTVFASGVQAIARILVEQLRVDRTNGLRTAAFASGYPGSPLASLDRELATAAKLVNGELAFVFQPGLNEELAATAVMGTQLAQSHGESRYDGVIGLWFAKAPGLDRACDAIRHANMVGTHPLGGALLVVGDDPAAKSSTLPSSSDATLIDLHVPMLCPVDVQDALDLGRHGIAMSRMSGLWSGLKVVTAIADGTATISLDPMRVHPIVPDWLVDGKPWKPAPNARMVPPYNLTMEKEMVEVRIEAAKAYGAANELNRVTIDPGSSARIGIAACGYTAGEVREALGRLGLRTEADIAGAGIRLMVLRMPYPLESSVIKRFCHGLEEVIVVEDKNPMLEWLVKDALWGSAERPNIVGKNDLDGTPLFPRAGHLDADEILAPLRRRLRVHLGDDRLAPLPPSPRERIALEVSRSPWFCSGCPHHWGTKVPEDTLYGAGIGCHVMTTLQPADRVGELAGLCSMGSEGMAWLGMEPFVTRKHFIQNLGDGTYFHSGQLAVQAAIAAKSNVTFKLLYNGAVAMTGGQGAPGRVGVPGVTRILLEQGVAQVLITTEDLDDYKGVSLPPGVLVWDRTRIVEAQELLRDVPGVTVLIHDQACAAELRRDRKRGVIAPPTFRVVINERVCEGCGDCGEKSGCLSVQPLDTPFGRKTTIEQTSCNLDASCLQGDCPSFMTVEIDPDKVSTLKTNKPAPPSVFPEPTASSNHADCTVRMTGIGGTGVVTVSQILSAAALLDGLEAKGLDQTGLSQKAGPVVSDVRIGATLDHASNKAGIATANVLIGFDLLVAANEVHLDSLIFGSSVVVASTSATPTGSVVVDPRTSMPSVAELTERIVQTVGSEPILLDASLLTTSLLGDASTANVCVLGAAYQAGALPVSASAIEEAIGLNGVAVNKNIAAFRWGRATVSDPQAVTRALTSVAPPTPRIPVLPRPLAVRVGALGTLTGLTELLTSRVGELIAFQDKRCAEAYLDFVEQTAHREAAVKPGSSMLTNAVATYLYQLTAYKDEYEVARLLTSDEATAAAEAVGGVGANITWKLHPPMLKALGLKTKIAMGPRTRPMMVALAQGKRVRGTKLDPFGRAHVRVLERELLAEYRKTITTLLRTLTADRVEEATRIASLPDVVRGYEDRKVANAKTYRDQLHTALQAFAP